MATLGVLWRPTAFKAVLENVSGYPHRRRYLAWPAPNSNTFASWVLRRAGIRHRLGWMALGKRYRVLSSSRHR